MLKLKGIRNRSLVFSLVVSALMMMPLGLPGGSNVAEAQSCWPGVFCPNGAFNVGALIDRIDVRWNGGSSYSILFLPKNNLTGGTCGTIHVSPVNVYNVSNGFECGSAATSSTDVLILDVDRSYCSGSFTVGYRYFHYLNGDFTNPRKVHSNLTINPNDFSQTGVFVQGYAPVSGC